MTIYKDDIKLMASQNMTDNDDGGGEMTGVEIVSGEHNSIFPDISDLDRAYGVVNIRSLHLAVKKCAGGNLLWCDRRHIGAAQRSECLSDLNEC